eukprot:TRINITY_DN36466_c0_g1_i1.p1 TRINITY_DN36466_c0_g1~~TRINITY_DN36466_c0_g1_i1.p1  ORF type:complete len:1103 (+),score=164.67 TRINITY_DN36466_c0_g1_i1:345-3311(+)
MSGHLAIQDFQGFCAKIEEIFEIVASNKDGAVADYIPQLAQANPEQWGMSLCSTSGQLFSLGDSTSPFCVQSTSKPVTYCMALELHGEEKVHRHVATEPSGRNFNERILKQPENVPHNPLINAGAIMTASLVKMEDTEWNRFDYVMSVWKMLSGGRMPGFQNSTFMGERATAARNNCLAWMMKEAGAFPEEVSDRLDKILEAYFSWCSIEVTCEAMAVVAGTLANSGICPTTGERVFSSATVSRCLSLMSSCGMYDYSGEFAFSCGFPAKSGVSGVLCIVIPGVCGIATFSPRLDSLGNSCRGIQFCRLLGERFDFHCFDCLPGLRSSEHSSPGLCIKRAGPRIDNARNRSDLWWAASRGDAFRIRQLAAIGVHVNAADYDGRTALHLAASEGHVMAIKLLLALDADMTCRDRHGHTPLDDALNGKHEEARQLLDVSSRLDVGSLKEDRECQDPRELEHFRDLPVGERPNALKDFFMQSGLDGDTLFEDLLRADRSGQTWQVALAARALKGQLSVPNFACFREKCVELQQSMAAASVEAAASICTIDGQSLHVGPTDPKLPFSTMVTPFLYCIAVEKFGMDKVHSYVGREPSGEHYEVATFNENNLPYNPFVMSGQLSIYALLLGEAEPLETANSIMAIFKELIPAEDISVSEDEVALVWKEWSDHASSLIYSMRHHKVFPSQVEVTRIVEFGFLVRSFETTQKSAAKLAAALANGGISLTTGKRVFRAETVRAALSLMSSCGMANRSGEFAFFVGVPARIAVRSQSLMLVVPGLLGCCVREKSEAKQFPGIRFCKEFTTAFGLRYNAVEELTDRTGTYWEPRLYSGGCCPSEQGNNQLLDHAECGDVIGVMSLHHRGCDLNQPDYDGRTAAHLAASGGQVEVLQYLHESGADMNAVDRWGCKPWDDAAREGKQAAADFLKPFHKHEAGKRKKTVRLAAPVGAKQLGAGLSTGLCAVRSDPSVCSLTSELPDMSGHVRGYRSIRTASM